MSKLHLEIFPCFPEKLKTAFGKPEKPLQNIRRPTNDEGKPLLKNMFFRFHSPKTPKPIFQKPKKKYIEHVLFFVAGPKNLSNKFSKPPSRPLKKGPVLRPGGSVPKRCDPLAWIKMSRCEEITHQQRHVSAGSFRSP